MFQLKAIDASAIPQALEKAQRYRLLNEPEEAESICLDILAVEPENQSALVMMLLALTDLFSHASADAFPRAQALLPNIRDEYERYYFAGIICERRGSAQLDKGGPGAGTIACTWLMKAMEWYEKAEAVRPSNNDDAILRWNTCARVIMKNELEPAAESYEPTLLE